ncbi:hypothetical protein FE634_15455 [Nocardioides dongxiaopingii]|uniref:hypothetical protein n=1 Tax=Nocardioides sp. S-1144 TaxID=2582905 RepID=UPI00110E7FFC|nr:hypothetical protein [Nocardioides sp. S-1144]QCW51455.1 hypothetical protein FE634_15455 [Nocardioides sp. S-1144]
MSSDLAYALFGFGAGLGLSAGLGLIIWARGRRNESSDDTALRKPLAEWARSRELQQFALIVFGLASIVTGAAAVFHERDGTTATAIVVAGFAVIALVYLGPRLLSIKLGTLELVLTELEKNAQQAENAGEDDRAEELRRAAYGALRAALNDQAPSPSSSLPAVGQGATEAETIAILRAALSVAFVDSVVSTYPVVNDGARGRPSRADLLVERADGRRVYIEYTSRAPRSAIERLERMAAHVASKDRSKFLVLTSEVNADEVREQLEAAPSTEVLAWTSDPDLRAVVQSVERLLTD